MNSFLIAPKERIPGFRPPHQERSRRSLARIVHATRLLCVAREAAELTLGEIIAEAAVSASSVYRRFDSKDSLLDYVHSVTCAEAEAELDAFVTETAAQRPGVEALAFQILHFGLDHADRTGPLLHAFRRAGAQIRPIAERDQRMERANLHRFESLILGLWDEPLDDDTRLRIRDTVRLFSGLIREGGDTPGASALFADLDPVRRAARLAELALRAVGRHGSLDPSPERHLPVG